MFVVLFFFGVTYRPQLDTLPPVEIIITVCHKKGRHPLPPNRYVLFERPLKVAMIRLNWRGLDCGK